MNLAVTGPEFISKGSHPVQARLSLGFTRSQCLLVGVRTQKTAPKLFPECHMLFASNFVTYIPLSETDLPIPVTPLDGQVLRKSDVTPSASRTKAVSNAIFSNFTAAEGSEN